MSDERDNDEPERERIRPTRSSPMRPESPAGAGWPAKRKRDEGEDYVAPPKSGGGGKVVLIVLAVVAIFGLCVVGGLGTLGYFMLRGISGSANKMQTSNNQKQIALAMLNYHDQYGQFPPVAMKTKDGKPGLSWRVALLPFLEHDSLYKQFKRDEAWDHPDNLRLAEQMPAIFAPRPGERGKMTHIRLFEGVGAIYDPSKPKPRRMQEITDGTSNTILFAESAQPVLWIQPDEMKFDSKGSPSLGLPENDYAWVTMADGSVRTIKKNINPEKLRASIGAVDGQAVFLDE